MLKIYDADEMPQGSAAWMGKRCGSIGASSAKQACSGGAGKTRKTLAFQLVAESITGEKTSTFQSDAMTRGLELESEARKYFEFIQGVECKEVGMVTNTDYPGCHASPDTLFEDTGLEIKCPLAHTHTRYLYDNKMVTDYKMQVQFTMMICEFDHYWFMSYHPQFSKQLLIKVARDDKYIAEMQGKLEIFFMELGKIKNNVL